jgi:hypothetical protein
MSDKVCAVVEFELTEFAHRAVRELNELNSVEGKMLVVELTEPAKKLQLIKKAAAVEVVKKPEPRRRFSHAGLVVVPHRQVGYLERLQNILWEHETLFFQTFNTWRHHFR